MNTDEIKRSKVIAVADVEGRGKLACSRVMYEHGFVHMWVVYEVRERAEGFRDIEHEDRRFTYPAQRVFEIVYEPGEGGSGRIATRVAVPPSDPLRPVGPPPTTAEQIRRDTFRRSMREEA